MLTHAFCFFLCLVCGRRADQIQCKNKYEVNNSVVSSIIINKWPAIIFIHGKKVFGDVSFKTLSAHCYGSFCRLDL